MLIVQQEHTRDEVLAATQQPGKEEQRTGRNPKIATASPSRAGTNGVRVPAEYSLMGTNSVGG